MLILWTLWLAVAPAQELSFEAVRVVQHGQDVPKVVFKAGAPGRVDATATCGGRRWSVDEGVARGGQVDLPLTGIAQGTHQCEVEVEYAQSNGAVGGTTFSLEVSSLPMLELTTSLAEVDTDGDEATVHASRALDEARVTVIGPRGVQLDQTMGVLEDAQTVSFRWNGQGQPEVKLVVEARDTHGLWSRLEVLPWEYAIPHEDVVFATGAHAIEDAEVPKLEAAWKEVVEAFELYGSVLEIQLYVGGYTDTVGDAASNRALSDRRARSIATWFRQRGFDGPVFYQGFGEDGLAVSTGDGVDEAANRRAVYLLTAQTPPKSSLLPRRAWTRL